MNLFLNLFRRLTYFLIHLTKTSFRQSGDEQVYPLQYDNLAPFFSTAYES